MEDKTCDKKLPRKVKNVTIGRIQPIGCNPHPIRLHDAKEPILSDGANTDRMEVDCSYKVSFNDGFTPHYHWWLIISH